MQQNRGNGKRVEGWRDWLLSEYLQANSRVGPSINAHYSCPLGARFSHDLASDMSPIRVRLMFPDAVAIKGDDQLKIDSNRNDDASTVRR